jgi:hypothetical protein
MREGSGYVKKEGSGRAPKTYGSGSTTLILRPLKYRLEIKSGPLQPPPPQKKKYGKHSSSTHFVDFSHGVTELEMPELERVGLLFA